MREPFLAVRPCILGSGGSAMAGGVLIVEDDEDIRADLAAILRIKGFAVAEAANGVEALAQMRDELPCVLLLDLMMPEMNGWELGAIMQTEARLQKVPIVVVSGAGRLEQSTLSLAPAAILAKPFELAHLIDVVARYCRPGLGSALR
jgi:DNA-binding response OmpR family regulator